MGNLLLLLTRIPVFILSVTTRFKCHLWLHHSSRGLCTANTGQFRLYFIVTVALIRQTGDFHIAFFLQFRVRIIKCGSSSLKDWPLSLVMDYLEVISGASHSQIFNVIYIHNVRFLPLSLLSAAAPGIKTLIPAATGVVISQTAQVYQPVIISQPAIQVDTVVTVHLHATDRTINF